MTLIEDPADSAKLRAIAGSVLGQLADEKARSRASASWWPRHSVPWASEACSSARATKPAAAPTTVGARTPPEQDMARDLQGPRRRREVCAGRGSHSPQVASQRDEREEEGKREETLEAEEEERKQAPPLARRRRSLE
jgi:hypothetical protein